MVWGPLVVGPWFGKVLAVCCEWFVDARVREYRNETICVSIILRRCLNGLLIWSFQAVWFQLAQAYYLERSVARRKALDFSLCARMTQKIFLVTCIASKPC